MLGNTQLIFKKNHIFIIKLKRETILFKDHMTNTILFEPGNYQFIPGVFQYSGGVSAQSGFRIERVRFSEPIPLLEGFKKIEGILKTAGRPLTAFCACELRSPAPFDEAGFEAFNRDYVGTLEKWGLIEGKTNPVARSNVCPEINPPKVPSIHAFCFTVQDSLSLPSFVVSGSAEAPEGMGDYKNHIVNLGDISAPGLEKKAKFVLDEMENRMSKLGFKWADTTATQVYTVHDIHNIMIKELVRRGAMKSGLTRHFNRPPVINLEYEMDCRSVHVERVI